MNNGFNPYGNMGLNIGQFDPYQTKVERYNNLQNQIQQSQQQINNANPFLTVANMQEAKEKVLAYNSVCWMRDSSEPYIYIKSVDMTGSPNFTILKLEDVTNQMMSATQELIQPKTEYVSIEQYNQLLQEVQQLKKQFNSYNSNTSYHNQEVIDVEPNEIKVPTKKVGAK